jgi:site-specific DNA recombinase
MTDPTAVIYARVSDRKQARDDVSVPSQIEAAERRAAELGARVLRVFTDAGRSAFGGMRRPCFEAAMDLAIASEATYFIVWSSARFARNAGEAATCKQQLDRAGVDLIYVSSPIDRKTDHGWLNDKMSEIIDESRSRQISQDTRRSMMSNAKSGFFCGGRAPFGYESIVAPENGKRHKLVPHVVEADLVREVFAMRASGMGAKQIAIALNGRGLRKRGLRWTKSNVLALLRSESVAGRRVFGRKNRRTMRLNPREHWNIMASHEPLVSPEIWERVQALLDKARDATSGGSPKSTHPFTGILRCGRCGSSLQIETARGRSALYSYYSCRGAQQGHACTRRRLRADAMDEWLTGLLLEAVLSDDNLREVGALLEQEAATWSDSAKVRRKALTAELQDLQRRNRNLFDILELQGRDAPNLGDLSGRLQENNARIRAIGAELEQLRDTRSPALEVDDEFLHDVGNFLRDALQKADNAARARAFYNEFVRGITVGEEDVVIEYDPARLVSQPGTVRSTVIWLPERALLRTVTRPLVPQVVGMRPKRHSHGT